MKRFFLLLSLIFYSLNAQVSDYYYSFNKQISITSVPNKYILEFENISDKVILDNNSIQNSNIESKLVEAHGNLSQINSLAQQGNFKINYLYSTSDGLLLYMKNSIVLKWKSNITEAQKNNLKSQFNLINEKTSRLYEIYKSLTPLSISKDIYESGLVEFCYPNFVAKVEKHDYFPNDTYFNQQFYLHNTGQILNDGHSGTVDADIDAPEAWELTTGSNDIVVAIIDEGVTSNHPDLPNSRQIRLNGSNFNPDDGLSANDPSPSAHGNHGNACAGIVAAEMDNNQGVTGIAPLSRIMPVKIPFGNYDHTVYADAITFAADNNANIISNSWGYNTSDNNLFPAIVTAIEDAINQGSIVLFSASNTANHVSGRNGFVGFPGNANVDEMITVGASDRNNIQANYSPTDTEIEIVAPSHSAYNNQIPGESFNVWSIDIPGTDGYNSWHATWAGLPAVGEILPSNGVNHLSYTGRMGGTSASTPEVAGVVALMLSVNSCLTNNEIIDILYETAEKIGNYNYNWNNADPGHSRELGYGKVNAFLAVQSVISMSAQNLDLYTKDGSDDNGIEPNTTTISPWNSPDIWIRNDDDNGTVHQDPEYRENGNPNYIYVKVRNRSCVASDGTDTMQVHWAKSNTSYNWPNYWDGSEFINGTNIPLGGSLNPVSIPVVLPGDESIIKIPWVVPNPEDYAPVEAQWHFCLMSRILSNNDTMTYPETGNARQNIDFNNNIAQKNVTIVDLVSNETTGTVHVGNPFNNPKMFYLEFFREDLETGKPIYEEAEVGVKMDDILYAAWERGGKEAENLDSTTDEKKKIVKGNHVILDNLYFNPKEYGKLTLDFNFLTEELTDKDYYKYHVVQKDSQTGEVLSGETFIIAKNYRYAFFANAGDNKEVNKNEPITISASDISEPAIYNWYDNDGNLIFQGKDLTISTNVSTTYKLEVIALSDGFKDYDEVEVSIKPNYIESISPNPASSSMNVTYKINNASSAYLMVLGYYGSSTSNNYILDVNTNNISIDLTNYPLGTYTVALVCDGEIVDAKNLIKQ